jgi:hypothetical protein
MIKQLIFTVIGNTDVDDDVIFCQRLVFTGVHPQLVIKPKKDTSLGAPRILKIIADVIDTQAASDPEITYNLDGDYFDITNPLATWELPFGDAALDPETPAKPGDDGSPSFNQGPFPPADIADPNHSAFDPLHWIGAYPKASDGGNGKPGGKGGKGVKGINAPILEIWTKEIVGNNLKLDLPGQQGGHGGKGGNGQFGGDGQMGSTAVAGLDHNWLGVPYAICVTGPGLGGNGGMGGNAGCGGDGGDGGNGGVVKIFNTAGVDLTKLMPVIVKGKGGKAGPPGHPGKGGKAGPPGISIAQCSPALGAQDGPNGDFCPRQGNEKPGVTQDGDDGLDGYYVNYRITNIPQVPWFP